MKNAEMKAVHFFSSGSRTYAQGVRQKGGLGCVPTYCLARTNLHAHAYVCASVDARAYVRDPEKEKFKIFFCGIPQKLISKSTYLRQFLSFNHHRNYKFLSLLLSLS